jgi:hypothetical protein
MKNKPKHKIKENKGSLGSITCCSMSLVLAVSASYDFVTSYYTMIDENYNGGGNEIHTNPKPYHPS